MKTNIVRIGNSRGIRIPKSVLEQCQLQDEVELEVRDKQLLIRPTTARRGGWDAAFKKMHQQEDDALLDQETSALSQWDNTEWEW